jgi:uncharacterized protein YbjT (DUF2867 family)
LKIAIPGSTGNVGRNLVRILQDRGGCDLVLLARDKSKLNDEISRGAAVRQGDITDTEYVVKATEGCDALFWINPPNLRSEDYYNYSEHTSGNAVAAVKANDIRHVVFVSSIGAHANEGMGIVNCLNRCEAVLKASIKGLTIMRCGIFMENYLWSLESISSAGAIYMPVSGNASVSMIAAKDVASRAADLLLSSAPTAPQVVSVRGPKDYRFDEAAKLIGKAVGREVKHVRTSPDQMIGALTGMGASAHVAELMVELYEAIDTGRIDGEPPRTGKSTTPTRFDSFARDVISPVMQHSHAAK